jgi:hypothetical protein
MKNEPPTVAVAKPEQSLRRGRRPKSPLTFISVCYNSLQVILRDSVSVPQLDAASLPGHLSQNSAQQNPSPAESVTYEWQIV